MKIRLLMNEVAGGWDANDIDTFLGGSEEIAVLLAEAFVRAGYDMTVYHNFKDGLTKDYKRNGVKYSENVQVNPGDCLITFKNNIPWLGGEKDAGLKIHMSADVETPWNTSNINAFVCLSEFHRSRTVFVPYGKQFVIPGGVDLESLDKNKVDKQPGTMLYCSSPDRGLMRLLHDWPIIKKFHPNLKLRIAYGFKNLDKMGGQQGQYIKRTLIELMKQQDITYLGQLSKNELEQQYHRSDYWCLPLERPDSELFCLNALKARYCGCIPVVNKFGALQNTVGSYIPYHKFIQGDSNFINDEPYVNPMPWDVIVRDYWQPLFDKILTKK